MWTVCIVNHSPDVTDAWLVQVAAAISRQLVEDFCPTYGLAAWTVTTDPSVPAAQVAILQDADQANVLGYHFVGPDGKPAGKVFTRGLTADEISRTISHEVLELVRDQDTRGFRLSDSGTAYADEACDAVEDTGYYLDGIQVSNFVTPAWYDDEGWPPFDHLGVLAAPHTKTPGGYWIEDVGGKVGTNPPDAALRKTHPASRTQRRLARRRG